MSKNSHLRIVLFVGIPAAFLAGFLLARLLDSGADNVSTRLKPTKGKPEETRIPDLVEEREVTRRVTSDGGVADTGTFSLASWESPDAGKIAANEQTSAKADPARTPASATERQSAEAEEPSLEDVLEMVNNFLSGADEAPEQAKLPTDALVDMIVAGAGEAAKAAYVLRKRQMNTLDPQQVLVDQRLILDGLRRSRSEDARLSLLKALSGSGGHPLMDEEIPAQLLELSLEWPPSSKLLRQAIWTIWNLTTGEKVSSQYVDKAIQVMDAKLTSGAHTAKDISYGLLSGLKNSKGVPTRTAIPGLLRIYNLQPNEEDGLSRVYIVELLARIEKTEESWLALQYIARNAVDARSREAARKALDEWSK